MGPAIWRTTIATEAAARLEPPQPTSLRLGSQSMGLRATYGSLALAAALLASCAGASSGPKVSAAEQKALPADGELILATAICPKSLVEGENDPQRRAQDLVARADSHTALLTLERAVRTHPDYTVTVKRESSDEAPYVWHEDISVLDLAKEMREEADYSATTEGAGTASPWAQCRHRLAARLDRLVDQAE
jgi:hypothetical protein